MAVFKNSNCPRTFLLPVVAILSFVVEPIRGNSGYLVVAPSVLRPGTEEVVSVTILKPSEPILVEAKLFAKTNELLTEAGHEIFGKGTLTLKIPRNVKGKCTLKICGNCVAPREGSYSFYNSTMIEVKEKGTSVFIQTDKPIYKPGQRVFINIITTDRDLKPVNEKLLIYIEDPRGSRMIQWSDLEPPCCGVANVSYPISDQPVLGNWRVIVDLQGSIYNRTFEIQKYVLPRYDVIIDPPRFVRDWRKCEIVYVRARYTFGKRVKGILSITATVKGLGYYKDYTGTRIAKTLEIHGVAAVNVCIDQIVSWNVGDHFRGLLYVEASVTTNDGATVKVSDSSCPVTKHLIHLEFTKDTRPHFKPGLPYKGRLRVSFPDQSPADNITVRVQADVNGKNFVARDYVSRAGLINFGMPAIPTVAQSVWLEAKVMKIGNDVVHDHYYPTYMSLGSWYSPSKCHTLIEGKPGSHKVGHDAKFYVHSTCPCNFTMYYEVMSRGNLVKSGIHIARHVHKRAVSVEEITFAENEDDVPTEHEFGDIKICTIFVKFPVTHEMVPISRLLVYYVRENGEGVADSLMFRVRPKYKNHLSVGASKREAAPGEKVNLHVSTSPESHVCVSAVDKSVHLLRPDFQLSTKDVFLEVEKYDLTVDTTTNVHWMVGPRTLRRNKRSSSTLWLTTTTAKDAQYAFEETGLIVMTDRVRLHFRQGVGVPPGPIYHRPGPGYYQVASMGSPWEEPKAKPVSTSRRKKRSFFPETWIWRCFNASTDTVVSLDAPDTITTWQIEGFSLSPEKGLVLADPTQMRTYKAFFVDFNLPYSVIRGEQVKIPLTIYNYLHSCVRVQLTIHTPEGGVVVPTHDIQTLCIGAEESQTVTSVLVFGGLGHHNITAEAKAYDDSRCCSGTYSELKADDDVIAYDHVTRKIHSEPEGITKHYVHSVFFCPNERIHLSTPNKYEFQYIRYKQTVTSVFFSARAHNDVRVSLSTEPRDNDDMYEIVIGGWSNSQTWIARGKEGKRLSMVSTKNIVSNDDFTSFWVSWQDQEIQVGIGEEMSNTSVLVTYDSEDKLVVKYLGFSTGWGSAGEFRIWQNSDMDGTYGEVFTLVLPENVVPGSERAIATITGDVMGPSIKNHDRLVSLPYGCGEQNMINFAPNTYILVYLEKTGGLEQSFREETYEDLVKGYQRQLTYRREDHSYSAFGDRDAVGNMWLTAFVLRSFAQAREFIYIDEDEINSGIEWIIDHQRRDGHFPQTGRLINKHIQGGFVSKVSLTAFVTTALLEAGRKSKKQQNALAAAKSYLESHLHLVEDPYTTALTSYALSLLGSQHTGSLLKSLNQMATHKDGFTYWKLHDTGLDLKTPSDEKQEDLVSAAEVETASYALLTYVKLARITTALPVVKWLSQQRNAQGGFISTQDTCVALQALAQYAEVIHSSRLNLTISLASTNMDLQERLLMTEENSAILQSATIPSLPTGLFVNAEGEGCALLQVDVSYNVADIADEPAFTIDVRLGKQWRKQRNTSHESIHLPAYPLGYGIEEFRVNIEVCTRWQHVGSSNMAVLEVSLLSGFRPVEPTLNKLLSHGQLKLKRYEIEDKKVLFYFDEIRGNCLTCVSFETYRTYVVGKTQPVPVKIYDYYEPAYDAITFYNASNIGHLTEELCEDEICNQIKENVDMPESDDDCNTIFGCYGAETDHGDYERCSCYRDCHHSGPKVCASDGHIHANLCRLEVEACRRGSHIVVKPMSFCTLDVMASSGDMTDEDISVTPLVPVPTNSEGNVTTVPSKLERDQSGERQENVTTSEDHDVESLIQAADPRSSYVDPSTAVKEEVPQGKLAVKEPDHLSEEVLHGSRVSSTQSEVPSQKEVGPISEPISDLHQPIGHTHDTSYETAKNVDKGSQNAENETFEKSANEQNDTLSMNGTVSKSFDSSSSQAKPPGSGSDDGSIKPTAEEIHGQLHLHSNDTTQGDHHLEIGHKDDEESERTLLVSDVVKNSMENVTDVNELKLKERRKMEVKADDVMMQVNDTDHGYDNASRQAIIEKVFNLSPDPKKTVPNVHSDTGQNPPLHDNEKTFDDREDVNVTSANSPEVTKLRLGENRTQDLSDET